MFKVKWIYFKENIRKKFQEHKLTMVDEIISLDERVRKLKIEGHKNYDNILLATLDTNDKLVVYTKNISANKPSILE